MLLAVPRFSRPRRIAAAPMRTYGKLSTDQPIGGSRLPEGPRRHPEFDEAKRIKPQTRGARPADPRTPPAEARVGVARQGESRLRGRLRPFNVALRPFVVARRLHTRRRRAPLATVRARRLPRRQPPPRVLVARPWCGKGGVKFHSHGEDTQGRREIPLGMVKMIAGIGRDIQPDCAHIQGRSTDVILLFRSRQFRFCK